MQEVELPELPPNARYLHHPNQCYDWGTFGWVLKTEDIDTTAYKHFIFLNSSVRGPFLPPYLQVCRHMLPPHMHALQLHAYARAPSTGGAWRAVVRFGLHPSRASSVLH